MDLSTLRDLLRSHLAEAGKLSRHDDIPALCEQLGLPPPPTADEASKQNRVLASFGAVPDADVPRVVERYLDGTCRFANVRNELQEALWTLAPGPEVPTRVRHDFARALDASDLYEDAAHFDALLRRLFVLDDDPAAWFGGEDKHSLGARIARHVYRNPGDWTAEYLFERLGAFGCSSRRFLLFLEGLASADVRRTEEDQRRFVTFANEQLLSAGIELRATGDDGGYPAFTAVPMHSVPTGAPKNIIFASSVKPDIRFRDAISNHIEVVSNADRVLVYDRPIGSGGLRWRELQAWWMAKQGITDDEEGKRSLYRRLQECLPENSPPQRSLFRFFFEAFRTHVPALPALLPEVWLHWDPKTVRERGVQALARFRMDFLLLLPGGARIVIEVDGRHHYASDDGGADPAKYAIMMAADRELRLAGYDVYRFGAGELASEGAADAVAAFFRRLFGRYGVAPDA